MVRWQPSLARQAYEPDDRRHYKKDLGANLPARVPRELMREELSLMEKNIADVVLSGGCGLVAARRTAIKAGRP